METMKRWMLKGIKKAAALALAAVMAIGASGPVYAQETEGMEGPLPNGKSVYNILLIGSDRRDDSWNGNSDVVILLTVNSDTQKLLLTSFMRDLYADIPGYGVHKLNSA